MCLQSLMKFHHCLFKIFKRNQKVADGRTDTVKRGYKHETKVGREIPAAGIPIGIYR